ncbi:formylglycine-generating enzyme family protein [Pseudomonas putida]
MDTIADTGVAVENGALLVRIASGEFLMGSQKHYPEERPERWETVEAFQIHASPVTNAMFARFVQQSGYVTQAERPLDPRHYPGVSPAQLAPASLVFTPPSSPVALDDVSRWWSLVKGADWRHPLGPGSDLAGLEQHPVVHVGLEDAQAYAHWAGCELPSEKEWEYAAWGGQRGSEFVWGDRLFPAEGHRANIWQGDFPWRNLALDGYAGTSPVGAYPANGYGLFDMIGNVWEWTATVYLDESASQAKSACCGGGSKAATLMVLKGGSHLCAADYCRRYRPPARSAQAIDSTSSHIGFRCVRR